MVNKQLIWTLTLLSGVLATTPSGRAQAIGNGVQIYTEPAGASFTVDGASFLQPADFLWPANSKHTVTSSDQVQQGTTLVYKGWVTNLNPEQQPSLLQPITADPQLKWIRLVFGASYRVTIDLIDCPNAGEPCPSPGRVEIVQPKHLIFDRRAQVYLDAGSTVEVRAYPNDGFVFTGWAAIYGLGRSASEFDVTFKLVGPTQLSPLFQPANAINAQINVQTDPPQLSVLLDRTPYVTPINLEWQWGTTHSVGVDPVQVGQGVTYVFSSWSDGGDVNHDFTMPSRSGAVSLLARFAPAALVAFRTVPAGLSLIIDGRQNWPSYKFAWLPGSTHKITAPSTQTDAQGRKYRFVSWSSGKTAGFDYVSGAGGSSDDVSAVYQPVVQATVSSMPEGLTLQIDGASCVTPCYVEKDAGATITVSAVQLRSVTDQSRLVFQGWNDSAEPVRIIALTPDARTYTANYVLQNRLIISAKPVDGAALLVTPKSPDGFYDAGTLVSVAANLSLGFRITMWSGDISGNAPTAAVALDLPKQATLLLDPVPAIAPLGIRSAAGEASPDAIAPGSLISIFGANLAPDLVTGSATPLAQTLAGVTVRVEDTFLPLLLVSPGQINAQLPSGLTPGSHKITVRWEGKPEISAPISVVRNAPGLFTSGQPDQPVGLFVRPDGSAITTDRPARPGETVSVLGTGLGPCAIPPLDGFLPEEGSVYPLVDPASVVIGDDLLLDPLYAGRSQVAVGTDAVRFRVPVSLPETPFLPVRIRVVDKDSNSVLLPISK
jgi:uncharacterized protein (TIGR03437 family)